MTLRHSFVLAACILCCVPLVCLQHPTTSPPPAATVRVVEEQGDRVHDETGISFTVTVPAEIVLGEPLAVYATLSNNMDRPVTVGSNLDWICHNFAPRAIGPDSREIKFLLPFLGNVVSSPKVLDTGQSQRWSMSLS